jgi:ubiquinone/menaquinone biosynthesis C-methylase UbiE
MLANLSNRQTFKVVDGIYLKDEMGMDTQGLNENKQKAIYDSRSESYKEQVKSNYPTALGYNHLLLTYREHLRWIKKLNLKDGERVLDIGCNIGQLLHLMSHQAKIKTVGIDISFEALQNAKINAFNSFDFVLCSVQKGIPFEDNSFDVITCMDVIEHLENPEFVLSEMRRVLKPGGRFLFHIPVTDIFLSSDWFYQKFFPQSFDKKMQDAGHFLEIMKSNNQLKEIIAKSGLEITNTRRFNAIFQTFFDYHMTHRILNRLFFSWKLPFKFYHLAIAPMVEIFILWPDRLLQKMGIGSSAYYLGKK